MQLDLLGMDHTFALKALYDFLNKNLYPVLKSVFHWVR